MLTSEQLRERKKGIGGSDSAGIVGVSKWDSPVTVYLDKISPDIILKQSSILTRGHILEPFIMASFYEKTGATIKTHKKMVWSEKNPFMFANFDGYIPDQKAIVEIKTAHFSQKKDWGTPGTDQIPPDYLVQCHHYLNVCNMNKAYVVVMFDNETIFKFLMMMIDFLGIKETLRKVHQEEIRLDIVLYEVHRNPSFDKTLIEAERSFWFDHVLKNIPPDFENCADVLALFPKAEEGKKIMATDEVLKLIQECRESDDVLKDIVKSHEGTLDHFKAQIQAFMKDAEEIINAEGVTLASWKNSKRTALDTTLLKQEKPEIYDHYSKTTQGRPRLVLKEI
jgi:putative phage-type endonuclease